MILKFMAADVVRQNLERKNKPFHTVWRGGKNVTNLALKDAFIASAKPY